MRALPVRDFSPSVENEAPVIRRIYVYAWFGMTSIFLVSGGYMVYTVWTTLMIQGIIPPMAVVVAMVVLLGGAIALHMFPEEKNSPEPPPEPLPEVAGVAERLTLNMDWDVTEVSLKYTCPCTPATVRYIGRVTFGWITCPSCRRKWRLEAHALSEG